MTIAHLGFEIDSRPLLQGKTNLEALVGAAGRVEQSAGKMSGATDAAFKKLGTGSAAADKLTKGLMVTEREMSEVNGVARILTGTLDREAAVTNLLTGSVTKNTASLRTWDTAATATVAEARNMSAAVLAGASAYDVEAAAAMRAADAMRNRNAAVNASPRGAGISTSNVAAQFQDVGVSAAMGMSPMMVALQQGTQLSAALGGQGLMATVRGLGAAFASILSPVSLLTIAVVGLTTAGIQGLMGMMSSTDDASNSLERHSQWLDKVLLGYESARDAAARVVEQTERLPQEVTLNQLQRGLGEQLADYADLADRAAQYQEHLNDQIELYRDRLDEAMQSNSFDADVRRSRFAAIIEEAQALQELRYGQDATNSEIERAIAVTEDLMSTSSEEGVRNLARDAYELANSMRTSRGEINSTRAALTDFQIAANQISLDHIAASTERAVEAINRLRALEPELRSPAEQAHDALGIGLGSPDAIVRIAALAQYNDTMAALAEQESSAEAQRNARAGASSYDQWGTATQQIERQTQALLMQRDALGMSAFEAERASVAFDLMNQAQDANLAITPELAAEIDQMATAYATASMQVAEATAAQQAWQEQIDFYRGTFQGFFSDLRRGLDDGVLGWDDLGSAAVNALNRIADRALSMAADGIFNMILTAFGLNAGPAGAMVGGCQILDLSRSVN